MFSAFLIVVLTWSEFWEYRTVSVVPRLEVDKARDAKLALRLNMTFPRVPCYLLSLDVVDVVGEMQMDINHDVERTRLGRNGESLGIQGGHGLAGDASKYVKEAGRGPDYCGSCYGADGPPSGCCNTCDDVREAYVRSSWSFTTPDEIQQCRDEHWTERIKEQNHEGCNIAGEVHINRVVGNLHLNPGRAFQRNSVHTHDLVPYLQGAGDEFHHFGHIIHDLSFGTLDEFMDHRAGRIASSTKEKLGITDALRGRKAHTEQSQFMFQYFLKVVPTEYKRLSGQGLETFQYSATSYERDLAPYDPQLGHDDPSKSDGNVVRSVEGIPGVFFNYEISPLRVIQTETRPSLWHFLSNLCAIFGGILTLAGLFDAMIYRGTKQLGIHNSGQDYDDSADGFYNGLDTKLL